VSRLRVARCDHGGGLRAENERLLAENIGLRSQLEEARRAGKRQAAPFSKGEPKREPARSGRKRGERYGRKAHRPVPDHVDEEIRVPLPDACPCCSGELEFEDEVDQYQEEILVPVQGHVRRYRIARGRCRRCGRRSQGHHPDQTSDAVGAAGSQLGPRTVAVAAQLNKELGVSVGKVAQILGLFGITVTPGGLYQALCRLARAAEPTYQALSLAVRQSAAVAADETGWRVAGRRQWLWVFVGDDGITVYLIAPGRGYEQAAGVLGDGFCRRGSPPAAGQRDRRLQQRIDTLIARNPTHAPNRKLLEHLSNEQEHLLTFLKTPGVAATNWRAEQAIRPAVVNRKNWGGNRTPNGAQAQQTPMSVIRTSRQQDVCPIVLLTELLRQADQEPSSMLRLPATTAVDARGP
jgi:hypothetical protein